MKKTLFILTLLTTYAGLAIGQVRMAPPRSTYFEFTGDTPEAFAQRRTAAAQSGPNRVVGTRAIFPRVLVIMANFSDYTFVSTKADVDSLFNATNWTKDGATGSVRQYFYDQSSGAYNPQFDIVGPVTLSQGYAYYGANVPGTSSPRAGEMVAEACTLVDDSVDFSQYDLNHDGNVDMVFVLYAGFGENDLPKNIPSITASDLVWPHYSRISSSGHGSYATRFDGKTIEDYECANELDGWYSTTTKSVVSGIGVLVHEFCHGLGLPDLYTSGNQYKLKTWGKWSAMDYGPYNNDMHTPPSLTAYERYFMGWLTPILANQPTDVTLAPLSRSNEAYIITANGEMPESTKTGTFWMLENRRKEGWDRGIPSSGLLLSQIKTWTRNSINVSVSDMKIDLLEADGIITVDGTPNDNNWYGKKGDVYPYGDLDSITVVPNYPITAITRQPNGDITFKVMGGHIGTNTHSETSNSEKARKMLINGQVVIQRGEYTYTIIGNKIK